MAATAPELAISPEKVCFLIVKARAFDAKDVATNSRGPSDASDDAMASILESRGTIRS